MTRLRITVTGMVQGVGYRWWTRAEAQRLGVSGWVKNRLDGRVEAEAEGDEQAVAALVDWMRGGPPSATVTAIETAEVPPTGETGFRISV
ncbi:acylphosphatase [Agromyces rhizosphaerae]|uniref:acylphosphatase n=1 Tax=Agromyces rhizosphaerae TaxID=88374 RepID=A0A9W6CX58_9MICO|nr:acylphosphatase [Agromyces rhizosphaerae]GLI28242.1 acylphosphatase [Agromyces rhizosphaerae]